ncbi:MAG: hypothetical protein N2449_01750 [Bacteroidales bacterium]|nr:hypothetical protein [Bacteroidales bacterium]
MLFYLLMYFTVFTNNPYKSISIEHQAVYSDIFQSLYIQQYHTLQKLDTNGTVLYTYSNASLGNVTHVDVSNPLEILVYHKEFNTVVFLSNQLNAITQPISLDMLFLKNVQAICQSKHGGFWVYDANQMQLILLNSSLTEVYKGSKIPIENITNMLELGNYIYISSRNRGIWKFNQKGEFIEFIAIEQLQSITTFKNQLVFIKNNEIVLPHNTKIQVTDSFQDIVFLSNTFVISRNNQLQFFKI